ALINLVPTPMPVGSYTFESTTATYSSIVGGVGTTAVSLSSMDDSISATQTLPFTFNFGGNNFTTFKINSNGWIQLGATSTSTTNYSSLSGSDNNIIAAFSRDLDGNNTTSYYVQTSGAVGSRITKIQWTNIRSFSSTASPATGNVQIWLYEGTNRVEIRYGDFTVTSARTSTGITCQVGLRGASSAAANVKSLSNTGSWATPTVGTSSSSTVALGNFASPILPDNGRVYRFSPLGNGTSTYTYAWSSVPAGFTANTAVATVNPSVNSTYNVVVTSSTGCTATASTSVVVDSTPPVITSSPVATQQLCQGTTATFTVAATSATALTYQWFKDGSPLVNGSGISGVTTATLTITGTTPASSGSYTVAVTNCS
ncbi:MAG: immunoglobulin domain-containing protein, partial [Bacteroidia bacterium]